MDTIEIYTDGSANLNKGISGYGWIIYLKQKYLRENFSCSIGNYTNNEEEYRAIINSLENLLVEGPLKNINLVNIKTDSELAVKQITGVYKIKEPRLKKLVKEVKTLCANLLKKGILVEIVHIPRELNKEADALARKALHQAALNME